MFERLARRATSLFQSTTCVYRKPYPSVMRRWDPLGWRNDRAVLLRSCRPDCQIASKCDPLFAAKNDPFDGAETGGAEPHIAEQSRSWRAASGGRAVMRGS